MSARVAHEIAENGVLTRLFLPEHGTQPACERVAVHGSLVEAAEWAETLLAAVQTAPDTNEIG